MKNPLKSYTPSSKQLLMPDGSLVEDKRVIRGGHKNTRPTYLRSARSTSSSPTFDFNFFGFRLCRTQEKI